MTLVLRAESETSSGAGPDEAQRVRWMLVDSDGFVERAGKAGEAAGGPADLEHAVEQTIGLRDNRLAHRLRGAIAGAISEARTSALLWRREGEAATLICVRPARRSGYALVRLEPLRAHPAQLSPATLVELFGLAPSEADIAMALASDLSVSDIAGARGVQTETVRGQIKSLLRKMELSSQKQLVRFLTRLELALT